MKYVSLLSHPLWQTVFYLFPLLLLVAISFWVVEDFRLTPAFTFDNYRELFQNSVYRQSFLASVWLGFSTALLTVLVSLPLAYAIAFYVGGRWRTFLIFSLLLPFLSSYVVRMFSWQLWISNSGILAFLLRKLGVLDGDLSILFTGFATRIGLLSILVPIATLIIYLSILQIDRTLVLAARDLGATLWQIFLRIILPLSFPGVCIAFLLSFITAFGDFIAASILGGGTTYVLSTLIADRVRVVDWPTAAALGVMMLLFSILAIAAIFTGMRFLPTTRYGR